MNIEQVEYISKLLSEYKEIRTELGRIEYNIDLAKRYKEKRGKSFFVQIARCSGTQFSNTRVYSYDSLPDKYHQQISDFIHKQYKQRYKELSDELKSLGVELTDQ